MHFCLCITFTCCLPSPLWGGQLCHLAHFSLCFSFMFTLPYLRKVYNPFSNRKRYRERGLLQISVGGLAPLSSVPLLQPTVLQWLERMKPRALLYFQLHLADESVLDCLTLGCLTRPFCISLQKKGDVGHAWPCSVLPGDSGQCSKVSLGPPAALICLRGGKDAE